MILQFPDQKFRGMTLDRYFQPMFDRFGVAGGLGDGEIQQGDDALKAILGAASGLPPVPKPENADASGLPQGAAAAAVNVIEVAAIGALILGLLFAVRLFE